MSLESNEKIGCSLDMWFCGHIRVDFGLRRGITGLQLPQSILGQEFFSKWRF